MRRSGRSNVVTRLTSKAPCSRKLSEFGVRSLAPAKPTAFRFCVVRLAIPFARVVQEPFRYPCFRLLDSLHLRENFYRRQRRKQRLELGLQPLRYLRFL